MKSPFRCTGARRTVGALALAAAAVAPAVLLGAAAPHAAPPQNVVAVGAILDLSDGWTSLGRASRVTLQLATADANAALARSGSPLRVRLQIADAKGEPAIALRQLRKLAADGVRVVVGPQSSSGLGAPRWSSGAAAVRSASTGIGVVGISQGSRAYTPANAGDNVLRFLTDNV